MADLISGAALIGYNAPDSASVVSNVTCKFEFSFSFLLLRGAGEDVCAQWSLGSKHMMDPISIMLLK